MQLTKILFASLLSLIGLSFCGFAQNSVRDTSTTKKLDDAEINILFSYYTQDGNNSPVTGGIGTEQLTDITPKIILSIPINEKTKLNLDAGFDSYTSASTDQIDTRMSSASRQDTRIHGNVGITRTQDANGISYNVKVGASSEYDYRSIQIGAGFSKTSKNGNREIAVSAQAFIDNWSFYFPEELRGQADLLPTRNRQSFNLGLTYSQVLTKRLQASVTVEGIYQSGLLSTPFHRVFFKEQDIAKVEFLPASRLKVPVGVRLNYHVSDFLLLRSYYRFYWDDWGVTAHTVNFEAPIKLNRFFSIYPFYRYHTQSAADYFAPYKEHSITEAFYTSDYDLAGLSSQQYGAGVWFSPVKGIFRFKILAGLKKQKIVQFKGIELRYAHYTRSNGLQADIISTGLNFSF